MTQGQSSLPKPRWKCAELKPPIALPLAGITGRPEILQLIKRLSYRLVPYRKKKQVK